jgi:hypothetical protein
VSDAIRVLLIDINDSGLFAERFPIYCTGVPKIGESLNLYELLTTEQGNEGGYCFKIEDVRWSAQDSKIFEPEVHLRRMQITG